MKLKTKLSIISLIAAGILIPSWIVYALSNQQAVQASLNNQRVVEVDGSGWIKDASWTSTYDPAGQALHVGFPEGTIVSFLLNVDETQLSQLLGKKLYCDNGSAITFEGKNAGITAFQESEGIGFIFKHAGSWWITPASYSGLPKIDVKYWSIVKSRLVLLSDG
jgi:hypothetical protein